MTTSKTSVIRVYVDTNVIINYCTGVKADVLALDYIFSKRRKEVLFTSSLAITQAISNLQTKKKTRKAFTKQQTISLINRIINKFTVINLEYDDILKGFACNNNDIEDNIHYVLSQKFNCEAILTNNKSDFSSLKKVPAITPRENIRSLIN